MVSVRFFKIIRLLPLLALPFLAGMLLPGREEAPQMFLPEQVNLALRRTADELLRQSGDSTSRIPAVERVGAGVWQLRLDQPFAYEQLPALLQASLELHGISQPYHVTVRRCTDEVIDLGYHQLDFLEKGEVPCSGREMPEGCHFLEVTFSTMDGQKPFWAGKAGWLALGLGVLSAGFWIFQRRKPVSRTNIAGEEGDWLVFGNCRLHVSGQVLICSKVRQELTFREAKLLRLFAGSPGQLLERDFIIRQVWADEGVLVGRSVDVFVSRLRKKLAADPSVSIVAVHGVGYRLETGKGTLST